MQAKTGVGGVKLLLGQQQQKDGGWGVRRDKGTIDEGEGKKVCNTAKGG